MADKPKTVLDYSYPATRAIPLKDLGLPEQQGLPDFPEFDSETVNQFLGQTGKEILNTVPKTIENIVQAIEDGKSVVEYVKGNFDGSENIGEDIQFIYNTIKETVTDPEELKQVVTGLKDMVKSIPAEVVASYGNGDIGSILLGAWLTGGAGKMFTEKFGTLTNKAIDKVYTQTRKHFNDAFSSYVKTTGDVGERLDEAYEKIKDLKPVTPDVNKREIFRDSDSSTLQHNYGGSTRLVTPDHVEVDRRTAAREHIRQRSTGDKYFVYEDENGVVSSSKGRAPEKDKKVVYSEDVLENYVHDTVLPDGRTILGSSDEYEWRNKLAYSPEDQKLVDEYLRLRQEYIDALGYNPAFTYINEPSRGIHPGVHENLRNAEIFNPDTFRASDVYQPRGSNVVEVLDRTDPPASNSFWTTKKTVTYEPPKLNAFEAWGRDAVTKFQEATKRFDEPLRNIVNKNPARFSQRVQNAAKHRSASGNLGAAAKLEIVMGPWITGKAMTTGALSLLGSGLLQPGSEEAETAITTAQQDPQYQQSLEDLVNIGTLLQEENLSDEQFNGLLQDYEALANSINQHEQAVLEPIAEDIQITTPDGVTNYKKHLDTLRQQWKEENPDSDGTDIFLDVGNIGTEVQRVENKREQSSGSVHQGRSSGAVRGQLSPEQMTPIKPTEQNLRDRILAMNKPLQTNNNFFHIGQNVGNVLDSSKYAEGLDERNSEFFNTQMKALNTGSFITDGAYLDQQIANLKDDLSGFSLFNTDKAGKEATLRYLQDQKDNITPVYEGGPSIYETDIIINDILAGNKAHSDLDLKQLQAVNQRMNGFVEKNDTQAVARGDDETTRRDFINSMNQFSKDHDEAYKLAQAPVEKAPLVTLDPNASAEEVLRTVEEPSVSFVEEDPAVSFLEEEPTLDFLTDVSEESTFEDAYDQYLKLMDVPGGKLSDAELLALNEERNRVGGLLGQLQAKDEVSDLEVKEQLDSTERKTIPLEEFEFGGDYYSDDAKLTKEDKADYSAYVKGYPEVSKLLASNALTEKEILDAVYSGGSSPRSIQQPQVIQQTTAPTMEKTVAQPTTGQDSNAGVVHPSIAMANISPYSADPNQRMDFQIYSDKNIKVGEEATAILDEMSKIGSYFFKYKNEVQGMHPSVDTDMHLGILAQELQASPLYKAAVEKDENGVLSVNAQEVALANTAVLADLAKIITNIVNK